MKISTVLLMCVFLQASAVEIYSQKAKVTIDAERTTLSDVLEEVERQTDYLFFYNKKNINASKRVSVRVKDKPVSEVLDGMLDENIAYTMVNDHIILSKKDDRDMAVILQQTRRITGTVTDTSDEPLIGANVIEKGATANGTVTDAEGNFSLTVAENSVLQISYVGYMTQEVSASLGGGGSPITIRLIENTQALDEVIVVGFGTQKKVNLTGSVSVADAKVFKERPVATASQALQGMVPGLLVTQFEGGPSYNPVIQIRGTGTIGKGSSAGVLVLIDGMEGDINAINPQDIESVSVLKDAAASSIYGSRAPFGVMLITTKRGKLGKPTLNYNNSFRWNTPVHVPEPVDSYTLALYLNDVSRNSNRSNLI
ncbi:MAG: TonB-dependent receptor plug domain-containing protein, partial [Tannerella sp.]|nr:TonB-dependent receptor plug domain-containing protein [Tannerella sp.]